MKIYDISQEVFSCAVYPGDPAPQRQTLCATDAGDLYNLTAFVGECFLVRHTGDVTGNDARGILAKSSEAERILIAGQATVTAEAAEVFAGSGILLLGNEGQTVGPEDAPMAVHKILLSREVALLEGIVLRDVPEGRYFLSAAPLKLAGSDGAPCRAYLIAL